MKKFSRALLSPDPEEGSVLLNTAKEALSSILPGRKI